MSRLFTAFFVVMLVSALFLSAASEAVARPKPLAGPIPAFVEKVVDGDTLVVRARIWLGQELRVKVRINGIDTPELRGRCDSERVMARSAKKFVKQLVGQRKIMLSHVHEGKYAGRVIADVTLEKGEQLADRLLEAKLARPYKRGKRKSWCAMAKKAPRFEAPESAKMILKSSAKALKSFGDSVINGAR